MNERDTIRRLEETGRRLGLVPIGEPTSLPAESSAEDYAAAAPAAGAASAIVRAIEVAAPYAGGKGGRLEAEIEHLAADGSKTKIRFTLARGSS
jgi:hypothetical protein